MVENASDTLPGGTAENVKAADSPGMTPPRLAAAEPPSATSDAAKASGDTTSTASPPPASASGSAQKTEEKEKPAAVGTAAMGATVTIAPTAPADTTGSAQKAEATEKAPAAAMVSEDVSAGNERPAAAKAGDNDIRGRWTIKSVNITPELLTAVRKAADRSGMKQGDWITDRLFRVAVDELKRETLPGPTLEDAAKALADIRARLEEQKPDPRIGEIAAGLRELGDKIDRPTRAEARMGAMMDYIVEMKNEVQRTRQNLEQRPTGLFARLFGRD